MADIPYQTEPIVLPAAAGGEIPNRKLIGKVLSVAITSATFQDDVLISTNGQSFFPLPFSDSLQFIEPTEVWIGNGNGAANTLVVGSGTAKINRSFASGGAVIVTGTASVAAADGALVTIGAKADAAATGTGSFSLIALIKWLAGKFAENPKGRRVSGQTASMTVTSDVTVVAAPGAGLHLVIHSIVLYCTHATVQTEVIIKNGAVEIFRVNLKAGAATTGTEAPVIRIPEGIQLASNTALVATNVTTGSATRVAAFGVTEAD